MSASNIISKLRLLGYSIEYNDWGIVADGGNECYLIKKSNNNWEKLDAGNFNCYSVLRNFIIIGSLYWYNIFGIYIRNNNINLIQNIRKPLIIGYPMIDGVKRIKNRENIHDTELILCQNGLTSMILNKDGHFYCIDEYKINSNKFALKLLYDKSTRYYYVVDSVQNNMRLLELSADYKYQKKLI